MSEHDDAVEKLIEGIDEFEPVKNADGRVVNYRDKHFRGLDGIAEAIDRLTLVLALEARQKAVVGSDYAELLARVIAAVRPPGDDR